MDPRDLGLKQRIRLGATTANASDARWATPWGRLHLREQISTRDFEAAEAYDRLLVRWRKILNAPKPWVQSPASLAGKGRPGLSPSGEYVERDRVVLEKVGAITAELRDRGLESIIERVIRRQLDPAPDELPALRAGLARLAASLEIEVRG